MIDDRALHRGVDHDDEDRRDQGELRRRPAILAGREGGDGAAAGVE